MKIMGCFRKQILIGAFITFCKFFQNAWQAFIFVHYSIQKLPVVRYHLWSCYFIKPGTRRQRPVCPWLPLSGKSVHVSAPQWCRMARPIFKKGLVALSV